MKTKTKNNKNVILIIPAFNEAKNIVNTIEKVKANNYDYIIVNDCSYDATDLICKEKKFNFISNESNLGLSKTMRQGFKYALDNGYEYAIQFDADGQHEVETIKEMISKIPKFDIVSSSRFTKSLDHDDKNKVFMWNIFRKLIKNYCSTNITDPTCGLRMYNRKFMEAYIQYPKFEVEPSTIAYAIKKLNMSFVEVPTVVHDRVNGESYFKSKRKLVNYIFKQIRRLTFTTKFWKYHK